MDTLLEGLGAVGVEEEDIKDAGVLEGDLGVGLVG